jgi:molybdopterin-guanine dinucleotide biosynthesis protein A
METSCCGVILAGGLNTRFSGREKAFISVAGERILDRLFHTFQEVFAQIVLVTNDPLKYLAWNALIVTDLFDVRSSLTGIHAGLYYAPTPYAFICACDAPFLKRSVVESVVNAIAPGVDVVIPETAAGLEPLCAAYSTRCLDIVERHMQAKKLKIQLFLNKLRVRKIPEAKLRQIDPQLVSFFNINSPEDLKRAEELNNGDDGWRSDCREPAGGVPPLEGSHELK